MTEPIPTRVQRGARLLDERLPGWVDRIDLDRLDLGSPCRCILGQTWGQEEDGWMTEYELQVDALELVGDDEIDLGFNARFGTVHEFAELTAEWRRLILARRAGAPS